ncbi:MAG: hypothetical protein LBD31_00535 [Treponema sp.]|nr:hypothetical protein [Treponema sp.]
MNKNYVRHILFIVVIAYSVCSMAVLFMAAGILPYEPGLHFSHAALVSFAVISCVLTVLSSAYHLSTMFMMNKRWSDRNPSQTASA